MPNVNEEDTYTATVGTETTIVDKVVNKHFDFYIDCSLLQSGESIELRLKIQVISTGALAVKGYGTATFPTTDKAVLRFPWESSAYNYRITGKQIGGVARDFEWILYDS